MGTSTVSDDMSGLKKGPWTLEEDQKLVDYIHKNGHGNWRVLPKLAGLNRCGNSCRLRWTNYLRPGIKRGKFSEDEEKIIIKLHSILGNKWSTIATHLPGRTDNEIKNYWNNHLRKTLVQMGIDPVTHRPRTDHIDLLNALIGNFPPQLIADATSNFINTNNNSSINRPLDLNSTLNNFLFPDTAAQLVHQIQWLQNSSLLVNSLISNANANTSPLTNIEALNQIFGSQNNPFDWNQLEKYYNSSVMNYQQYLSNNSSEELLTGKNDPEINAHNTGGSDELMVSGTCSSASSSLGNHVITATDQILRNITADKDVPDELGIMHHDSHSPESPSSSIEMPMEIHYTSNIYSKQEPIMLQPSSASTSSTFEACRGRIMGDDEEASDDSYWRDIVDQASRSP